MVKVKFYVEGGGDYQALKTKCRKGFSNFTRKYDLKRQPSIVACGSREQAYKDFCTAVKQSRQGILPLLLVDSEAPIIPAHNEHPWKHLQIRDKWQRPDGTDEEAVHLMVQCMETWFLADTEALSDYFGQHFRLKALPANTSIESVNKDQLYPRLKQATKETKKGVYGKGAHSFDILERLDPTKICSASPWAKRFFDTLKEHLGK